MSSSCSRSAASPVRPATCSAWRSIPATSDGGRGKSLVADALCWMHDRHLANALVNTAIGNTAALALYDQFGFRQRADRLTIAELDLTRRG